MIFSLKYITSIANYCTSLWCLVDRLLRFVVHGDIVVVIFIELTGVWDLLLWLVPKV